MNRIENITKKEWAEVIFLLLGMKIICLAIFFFAQLYLPKKQYPVDVWMTRPETRLIENLANFDGAWYIRIAGLGYQKLTKGDYDLAEETKRLKVMDQVGYEDGVERKFAYRHWPLFPWLIRLFAPAFKGNYLYASIFLSTVFYFICGAIFYRIARLDFSAQVSLLALLLFLIHPVAYLLHTVNNISLILGIGLLGYYYFRKNAYFISGILGLLAGLSRLEMIIALPLFIYDYLRKDLSQSAGLFEPLKFKNLKNAFLKFFLEPKRLWFFLIILGGLVVWIYFAILSGSIFTLIESHMRGVFGHSIYPGQAIILSYKLGPRIYLLHYPYYLIFSLILIFSWRKIPMGYWFFIALTWLGCTLLGLLALKHTLLNFPLFFALAKLIENKPILKYIYIAGSSALMTIYAVMHINAYFVW